MKTLEVHRPPAEPVAGPGPGQADVPRREFRSERRTRFSELDRFGRVHNLSLIQYIEDAQIEFTYGRHDSGDPLDVRWAAAQRNVAFLRPLPMLTDPVAVFTVVTRLGRATMTLSSRIEYRGVVHARSEDRFLACDANGTRRRLDTDELRWLREWAAEGEDAR